MEFVAGIDALGGVAGEEVDVVAQAGLGLNHGDTFVFGHAGIDSGFVHYDVAGLDYFAHGAACAVEGSEVGSVVAVDGSGHGHDVEIAVAYFFDVGGATEAVVGNGVLKEVVGHFESGVVALH